MNKNNFSINLIRIRRNKGLSQKDLADKCGISQRVIAHYETNAVNPSITKIQKIANVLEVTTSDLLKDYDTTPNNSVKNQFENLDIKTLKRLKQIANLTPQERNAIYTLLDALLEKKERKKSKQKQLVESKN